ncbi:MAG: hydantoinase B/oxoprolinase family protein [Alphaproteobacteria bacterium]
MRGPAAPDTFTLEIVEAALTAAADEMFAVLRRTAMSPIIYEVLDVGTGLTDAAGNLISSGAGIPTFVGVLDKAVRHIAGRFAGDIADGDIFLTNDPYHGAVTHLNDAVVAQPVFAGGAPVAWAASIAHWSDIGGRVAGSMAVDATDIHQEGLRLPAVKLFDRGRPVTPVLELIRANSRLPDILAGDLWAQVAAGRRGAARIAEVVQRHGRAAYDAALQRAFDRAAGRAAAGLAALPPRRYRIAEEQDHGPVWRAAIAVAPDRFTVDLTEAPDQSDGPWNTSRDGAVIAAQMIFKALTDPSRQANAGSYRALEVLTRPGSVFHAREPAPHGYYFETRIRLFDLLWRCLAEAMPERLPAGHFASICGTVLAGRHADSGRAYTMVEPQQGGWGATAARDGLDAMFSASHGETYNCPVEIAEARYGHLVGRKTLRADAAAGGTGRRGGCGVETLLRLRAPATLSVGYGRTRVPVWPLAGGAPGGVNGVGITPGGQAQERLLAFASGVALQPGDEVRLFTAQGGGHG